MPRPSKALKKEPIKPALSTPIPLPPDNSAKALRDGLLLQQAGKFEEAIKAYDEVLKRNPRKMAAIVNKGAALRRMGRHNEAIPWFLRALAIEQDNVEAWQNMGNTLLELQRTDEAEEAMKAALAKAPLLPEVWVALARLLLTKKFHAAGEAALKRAVSLRPDDFLARLELATLWLEQGETEEHLQKSLAEYRALEKIQPDHPRVHGGIGQALTGLGQMEEALRHLKISAALDPKHLDARLGLARWHLLMGDFEKGWAAYEARRERTDKKKPKINGVEWDGSDPRGKTILIYAEQGFGDTIQFLRFLTPLANRGAKVIVVCQKSLVSLVETVEGVAKVTCLWRPLPKYDFYAPLLSLPHKLKLGAKDLPGQIPYIATNRQAHFPPAPQGTKLRVGLVWAGSATNPDDHNRTTGLEALMPLMGIPGVRFYSLQVGPRAKDIDKHAHPALIADFSKYLKEYADTAAVIKQLDLVISVDTSVAHLTGALGKPCWCMVPCVPDWRWQLKRDDSPWYPTMRLFRNSMDGDWTHSVREMTKELKKLVAQQPDPVEPATATANSIFVNKNGEPRFTITTPRHLLNDPGVGFMIRRERIGAGYEYGTRSLLDAHLEPGDVFLDIGAHWGIMSMQAATRWPDAKDPVRVLAFEPSPDNVTNLKRTLKENDLQNNVEIVAAAVSDRPGKGELAPESTMGHSLLRQDGGHIPVVTVDDEMKKRKDLKGRRVIVKIDVEGHEPEVIAGMKRLLTSGNVAIVIWERGVQYNGDRPAGQQRLKDLRALFDEHGFTAWRFEREDEGGTLVPFVENGHNGNIIEFAPGIKPKPSYGQPRPEPVPQIPDPSVDRYELARNFYAAGTQMAQKGNFLKALDLYAEAGSIDSRNGDLFNNLGVLMRDVKRPAAKTAAYSRAHALKPQDTGILSNLANAYREEGRFDEAEALHGQAMQIKPNDPVHIYNAALVHRDNAQPQKAIAMLDQSLALRPDNPDVEWDRALLLLQQGDYERGLIGYETRTRIPKAYKRKPLPLKRWDGSPLEGRSIFLHDEQGFGDVLQFARFIPMLKDYGVGKVVLECQPELMRLMTLAPGVDAVVPRERVIPQCDVYLPLLSLPGLLGITLETLPKEVPYLNAPEMAPQTAKAMPNDNRLKLGIVWAGQLLPRDRSCPLGQILPVLGNARFSLFSLQVGDRSNDLKVLGADTFITDMSPYLRDFAETAAVLSNLDALVTIDTSVAHLAGALGIPTFLMLRRTSDWRWFDRISHSPWYPSFRVFRQTDARRWREPLADLETALKEFADGNMTGLITR